MRPILCRPEEAEMFDISHGLRQPAWRQREVEIERIDLVIVPALAFDRAGNRLGRGGGFYDRFLARPGLGASKIGLAFDEQIVDTIPVGPNDIPVDIVVTDKEIIR
jgi:5-formyltetrahydrofolate cyclo-ligase